MGTDITEMGTDITQFLYKITFGFCMLQLLFFLNWALNMMKYGILSTIWNEHDEVK